MPRRSGQQLDIRDHVLQIGIREDAGQKKHPGKANSTQKARERERDQGEIAEMKSKADKSRESISGLPTLARVLSQVLDSRYM
jgi:hypothetical protein